MRSASAYAIALALLAAFTVTADQQPKAKLAAAVAFTATAANFIPADYSKCCQHFAAADPAEYATTYSKFLTAEMPIENAMRLKSSVSEVGIQHYTMCASLHHEDSVAAAKCSEIIIEANRRAPECIMYSKTSSECRIDSTARCFVNRIETYLPAETKQAIQVPQWYMYSYYGSLYGIATGLWAASVKAKWYIDHGMPEKAEKMREYFENAMQEAETAKRNIQRD